MRFRSGTLQRSVRRWGPRTNFASKFKRKQYMWKYSSINESSIATGGSTPNDTILLDSADWDVVGGTSQINVKNVGIDMAVCIHWSPEVTTNAFESWFIKAGLFVLDSSDIPGTIDTAFANERAIWWHMEGRNSQETTGALANARDLGCMNWRFKRRIRFMKDDDELRFIVQPNGSVASVIADLRLSAFMRISWEIP